MVNRAWAVSHNTVTLKKALSEPFLDIHNFFAVFIRLFAYSRSTPARLHLSRRDNECGRSRMNTRAGKQLRPMKKLYVRTIIMSAPLKRSDQLLALSLSPTIEWKFEVWSMPLGARVILVCCMIGGLSSADTNFEVVVMVSSAAEFNTSGVIPDMDLALDMVNSWSLPFNLSYNATWDSKVNKLKWLAFSVNNDQFMTVLLHYSQCDYEQSLQFLQGIMNQTSPLLVALIGCGCSIATEAVGDVPELRKMPVVSLDLMCMLLFPCL